MEFVTDPWNWWIEPFAANPFMRRALYAALLAALSTSIIGTWVVLRGLSFLGDALAHGVLPGIAVALILGGNPTVGALVAALVMVSGISTLRRYSPLPTDTAIGLLFVGMLALAVVIMSSQRGSYAGDLTSVLFGSITGVDTADIHRQIITSAISAGGAVAFYRAFLVLTFDETQARMLGLRPRLTHFVLLALLAVAIVSSFEVVGTLLVFALLIGPPATAALLLRRVPLIMAAAVVLGAITTTVGILISYHHDTAAGGTMALSSVALFLAVLALKASAQALIGRLHPALRRTGTGRTSAATG